MPGRGHRRRFDGFMSHQATCRSWTVGSTPPSLKQIAFAARGVPEAVFEHEWSSERALTQDADATLSSAKASLEQRSPCRRKIRDGMWTPEERLSIGSRRVAAWDAALGGDRQLLSTSRTSYLCPFATNLSCNGASRACIHCRLLKGLPTASEQRNQYQGPDGRKRKAE